MKNPYFIPGKDAGSSALEGSGAGHRRMRLHALPNADEPTYA